MRIGLFVDIDDTFKHVSGKYQHKKLDYSKLYEYVKGIGRIVKAMAYGITIGTEATGFIKILHTLGYDTDYQKTNRTKNNTQRVNLTVDVLDAIPQLDRVILVISNMDYLPLCKKLKDVGKNVIVIGSNIHEKFKQYATCIEIPVSWLEEKNHG